jgi:probable HAF family extracellular repeat protein
VVFKGSTTPPAVLQTLGGSQLGPSAAFSINDTNMVVGQSDDAAGNLKAVLWVVDANGQATLGPIDLGTLGGTSSAAYFISNDGTIVGEAMDASGKKRATLWKADLTGTLIAGPVDLGTLVGDTAAVALGVNASGVVVGSSGGNAANVTRAVSWTVNNSGVVVGGPTILGSVSLPAGQDSVASAINDSGRITGVSDGVGVQGIASSVVWDTGLVQNIHDTVFDSTVNETKSVNASGQLAGSFTTGTGQLHPFVATAIILP